MSDGALSQEEIDSLLAGLDSPAGGPAPAKTVSAAPSSEVSFFKEMLEEAVPGHASTLSTITGQTVKVGSPVVDTTNRDGFLQGAAEEVVSVKNDFSGSFPGDHLFVISKAVALRIAAAANHEDSISELDDMHISTLQECFSMLSGAEVTLFSDKTGNRSIQTEPAEGGFMPKAMVKVPSGDFVRIVYPLTFEDGSAEKIIELFSLATVRDVVAASGGMKAEAQGGMSAMGGQMQMPMGGQMQMPTGGQMQMPMGGQMQMPMGGQMQMPGYGMQGGGGHYQTPNVQQVQFGNLMGGQGHQEAGNIGLIMDVYMELTVEIGRTKKPIKEILGFGEGTIIELDKLAGENVDVLVNHKLIAKGEVVVIDESFGVRITEIVSPMERMADMT